MRRARSRLDARGRLHLPPHPARERRSRPSPARAARDDALPERRWKLEPLSRRSGQHIALGQVLLLGQADGHWSRRSAPCEVPRVGAGSWRRGGVQHLHQDVPLRPRPVRLRCRPGHPAGDRSLSQLVLLQHLRNFVVVAVHPCAAGHHLRQEAIQEDPPRARHRRTLRRRPRQCHPAPAHESQSAGLVAQFLPDRRPDHALGRGRAHPASAQAGAQARRKVDARPPRNDRRPGRHLSCHAERDPGAALPRIFRRRSPGDPRPRRIRKAGHRAGAHR